MLDPHVRIPLPPVPDTPGEYSVTFRAPDRHGVFKFVIDHRRKGCAQLHTDQHQSLPLIMNLVDGRLFKVLPPSLLYHHGMTSTQGS